MKNSWALLAIISILALQGCCKDKDEDCTCYYIYNPVCGADGVTYPNDCFAKCAGVEYTEGPCTTSADAIVKYYGNDATEGCGWKLEIMEGDDLKVYHPEHLDSGFEEDGLEVSVEYILRTSTYSCIRGANVQYPVVTLSSIDFR